MKQKKIIVEVYRKMCMSTLSQKNTSKCFILCCAQFMQNITEQTEGLTPQITECVFI